MSNDKINYDFQVAKIIEGFYKVIRSVGCPETDLTKDLELQKHVLALVQTPYLEFYCSSITLQNILKILLKDLPKTFDVHGNTILASGFLNVLWLNTSSGKRVRQICNGFMNNPHLPSPISNPSISEALVDLIGQKLPFICRGSHEEQIKETDGLILDCFKILFGESFGQVLQEQFECPLTESFRQILLMPEKTV